MLDQSAIGVYTTLAQAEKAVRLLDQGHFPITQISIVAQQLETEKTVHGFINAGDGGRQGAGAGAWFGGIFGLLMGGAFLAVPGIGPVIVAGSLAAVLLGTVEGATFGAVGGGLLGALSGWGVSRQHIIKYEDHVKGGRYLLVTHGNAAEVARAQQILQGSAATVLQHHTAENMASTAPTVSVAHLD